MHCSRKPGWRGPDALREVRDHRFRRQLLNVRSRIRIRYVASGRVPRRGVEAENGVVTMASMFSKGSLVLMASIYEDGWTGGYSADNKAFIVGYDLMK